MRRQMDLHGGMDVEPFRMMAEGLRDDRDGRHEAERRREIPESEGALHLVVNQRPVRLQGKPSLDLGSIQALRRRLGRNAAWRSLGRRYGAPPRFELDVGVVKGVVQDRVPLS